MSWQKMKLLGRRASVASFIGVAAMAINVLHARADAVEDFYKGKQVTIIVGYGSGGGYDVYARVLARHLGRFIPGNPTVIVQNMPGAGSLRAANYIYNVAPKDGTAIAMFSPAMPVRAILGGNASVKFDAEKLTWLGSSSSFANDAYMLVVRADGPNKTVEEARRPGGPPIVLGSSAPGSNSHDIPVLLHDALGLNVKMVTGYRGSAGLFLATERGEVQGRMVNLTGIKAVKPDWLKPDSGYKVLLQFGRKTRAADLKDVPTARELAANPSSLALIKLAEAPFEFSRPFAAPPGIPADRAKALQKAFQDVHRDPQFLADAQKADLDISPTGPQEVAEALAAIRTADPKHLDYLRKLYAAAKR